MGGFNFILSGMNGIQRSSHFVVGTFCVTALGLYKWCDMRRQEEARGMAAAVTGMKMLHEKKAKEEAERKRQKVEDDRRRLEEEEQRRKNKSWYKRW